MYQKTKTYMARSRRVQYKNIMYFCKLHATSGAPRDASSGGSRIFGGGPFWHTKVLRGRGRLKAAHNKIDVLMSQITITFKLRGSCPPGPHLSSRGPCPPLPRPLNSLLDSCHTCVYTISDELSCRPMQILYTISCLL